MSVRMADVEDHFTVFIRLPFPRGDFVDPPPVIWSASKERDLWDQLAKSSKGHEIDWTRLAERLDVTQAFLLQQAAWLYERQLSQVRAQMRRIPKGTGKGSVGASNVGSQAMQRTESGGSRVPSRLASVGTTVAAAAAARSNQPHVPLTPTSAQPVVTSTTPGVPHRTTSTTSASRQRADSATSTGQHSRRNSRDYDHSSHTYSRRGSTQHAVPRSPRSAQPTSTSTNRESSSEGEFSTTQSQILPRRSNPAVTRRPNPAARPQQHDKHSSLTGQVSRQDDNDEEDEDTFLPFSNAVDQSSRLTLQTPRSQASQRNTAERIRYSSQLASQADLPIQDRVSTPAPPSSLQQNTVPRPPVQPLASNPKPALAPTASAAAAAAPINPSPRLLRRTQQPQPPQRSTTETRTIENPNPNPSRNIINLKPGSDTSPSIGSSFSDLDEESLTRSALEEALLSGMANTTVTTAVRGNRDGDGGGSGN